MSESIQYLVLSKEYFTMLLTGDELTKAGVDIGKIPTSRYVILDTGPLRPIRDLRGPTTYALLTDLQEDIPVSTSNGKAN